MHAPSNFHANTAQIIPLFRAPTPGRMSEIVKKLRSNRTEAEVRKALQAEILAGSGVIK